MPDENDTPKPPTAPTAPSAPPPPKPPTAPKPKPKDAPPAAAAPMVTVKNVSGRLVTLVLAGKHLENAPRSEKHRYKPVKLVTVHHAKNGDLAIRVRKIPMATSLRIAAGEEIDVEKSATYCNEFKKAIANKRLRVLGDPAKTKTEPAAPAAQ